MKTSVLHLPINMLFITNISLNLVQPINVMRLLVFAISIEADYAMCGRDIYASLYI